MVLRNTAKLASNAVVAKVGVSYESYNHEYLLTTLACS